MKCLCILSVAAAAIMVAIVAWELAEPPLAHERHCDRNDTGIFHDPDFVVTGLTVDVATGCIVSIETETRRR
jgi:hypothetical protein